jgi:membrane associated rhomboid family serine protease
MKLRGRKALVLKERVALHGMMLVAAFIYVFCGLSPCQAAKLTDSQIHIIQANIRKSTDLSTKCLELYNSADQKYSMASSNFQRTSILGFLEAADVYAEAESKSLETRNLFNDAWIQMQLSMQNDDLASVQRGIDLHNTAVLHYNEVVQLLNRAGGIFNQAVSENQSRPVPSISVPIGSGRTSPTDIAPNRMPPSFPPASFPQDDFPIVALIILLSTAITSVRALKDKVVYGRYVLHPWSIVKNKTRYYTLISYGLLHKNSMHLLGNLLSFSLFALPLEGIIGHFRFVLVYFGSLIFSSIIVTMEHGNNASYCCVGASGGIMGVIFGYILHHPHVKIGMLSVPMGVPAMIYALGFLTHRYLMSRTKYDNVAHDAHLGGAIAGAMITVIVDPRLAGIVTTIFH